MPSGASRRSPAGAVDPPRPAVRGGRNTQCVWIYIYIYIYIYIMYYIYKYIRTHIVEHTHTTCSIMRLG